MFKSKTPKSAMYELPSRSDFFAEAYQFGILGKNPNLNNPRAKLISYISDSHKISRGINHVSILVVGSSGAGKSSTINHMFDIGWKEVQFAKTSSTKSETRITSEFLAFADDPDLEVKNLVLGIVDTPGFNDTDGLTQDACNFYSIKKFYEGHPKVPGRFPNLIFVVVPATDTCIAEENSNLSKSLRCLNELRLVDHRRPNVVAVLSFCCSVSCKKVETWKKKMENKKKVVQEVIFDALKVYAPVVVLENDFEAYGLEKDGGFTKLPNGELQPKNLYDACKSVLRKNEDNLGLITFNACFLKLKTIEVGGYKIAAKDASKDALDKEEEEFVKYFERAARGGREDPIFDTIKQFIQSRNLDDKQKQEAMELTSTLNRVDLQECSSVTFERVQWFHENPISPTGKTLLKEKFGIQADSGKLHNLSKNAVKELPSSKRDLLTEATSLGLLGKDATLDKPRAKLISYINDSHKINRSFNHVSLMLVGSSGVGKSSTINHLLNIGEERGQFAETSTTKSETRITSEFLAFADDPKLEVKNLVLGIVDTPGFNDTDGIKQDACNFYSIKKFYEGHPKLRGCFPNLIFVVVQATDTRIAGENSNLSKSLRCLNELSLVDHGRPNVVVVLSFCCSVPCIKVKVWKEMIENKKKLVQDLTSESLKVNAPVVALENGFELYELEKVGDFTKLPNGELQPKNLYDACQKVLRKNTDNLGLVTFNACFLKSKKIKCDGHQAAAKDASKQSLTTEEEKIVLYMERAARGGSEDPIFDATQEFVQSKNLDNEQKQEVMELASSLKRVGLQDKEDCASITVGTVQYFQEELISPTGKNLLKEKFGIQETAANLNTGCLIGEGFNILNDKRVSCDIMEYETTKTDFGVVIPTCAKFEKVLESHCLMDQFETDSKYVQSRLSQLNVSLNVQHDMLMSNTTGRAGFNKKNDASSASSMIDYSFLYEQRMFKLKMANFEDYVGNGIKFKSQFVSAVRKLPENYEKNDSANRDKFERFFNQFGHFIVTAAYGGGSIETKVTSQHGSDTMSFEEVKGCLSASFAGGLFNADGVLRPDSLDMEAKSKTMLSKSTVRWCGGSHDLHVKDTITNQDKMSKWKLSLGVNPTMLTSEMCLEPISTVISCVDPKKDTASYDALKDLLGGEFKVLANREREREEENKKREEEAKRLAEEAETRKDAVQPPDPPSSTCFPASTIVYIKDVNGNIKKKQMSDLFTGDRVQACDTKSRRVIYSEVIMFAHCDPGVKLVNYMKIVLEDASNIVLSSNHLIMSGERMKATMARNIKVDHMLFTINEEGVISSKKVVAIEEIIDSGVFGPITKEGNVVVNNILASCYASVNDQAFFHGLFKISAQNVAHLGLLPMRVLNKFRVRWVGQSAEEDEFIHPYVRWLCKLKLPWMDGEQHLPPVS